MDILRLETVEWLAGHGETEDVRAEARDELARRRAYAVIVEGSRYDEET
jgi:hypothetical protein